MRSWIVIYYCNENKI